MSDPLREDLASLRIDRHLEGAEGSSSSRAMSWVKAVVVVALGLGTLAFVRPALRDAFSKPEVATTELTLVAPQGALADVTTTGYVVPQKVARVGAKIGGRVARVLVKEGETVALGQPLFELDPSTHKGALASARARVASAKAKVALARANAVEVQVQFERQTRMVESGAAAPASAEDLGSRHRALLENVRAAEAEVAASEAEMEEEALRLRSLTIVAPIAGTALTKPSQVGDVVSPGPPLVELADFSELLIESDVPEGRLSLIRPGAPCEVVLDSAPDQRLRGEVVELGPRLNRAKATATVKVRVLDQSHRLRPDMGARVSFLQKPLDPASLKERPKLTVPGGAVVNVGGTKAVFVLENSVVRRVPLVLGAALGSSFEVLSGPGAGTKIVKDPPPSLMDGQEVKERKP